MLFDRDFEVLLADTEKSKDIHYQLRYRVYCEETGFEDPCLFQSGREVDEYDDSAVHFIVRKKETGEWIAALRLIVAKHLNELPISLLMPKGSFLRRRIDNEILKSNAEAMVEVSRLCVTSDFRNGKINSNSRREPEIMLGLLRAVHVYATEKKIDCGFFTVTHALARILRSLNMRFLDAGPECNYRGRRIPYYVHVPHFLSDVHQKSEVMHQMFQRPMAYCLSSEAGKQKLGELGLSDHSEMYSLTSI